MNWGGLWQVWIKNPNVQRMTSNAPSLPLPQEEDQGRKETQWRQTWVHQAGLAVQRVCSQFLLSLVIETRTGLFCGIDPGRASIGEGTLYWVLVSQKGQRKILVYNKTNQMCVCDDLICYDEKNLM